MLTYGPREVSWNEMEKLVLRLGELRTILNGSKACYIYGAGGLSRNDYISLQGQQGISVKFYHSALPKLVAALTPFIPSYAGLVEILDPSQLMPVFEILAQSTMAGIYIIDRGLAEGFLGLIRVRAPIAKIDTWVAKDERAIVYRLDSSNPSSRTDMYDWLFVGENLPHEVFLKLEFRGGKERPGMSP